MVLFFNFPPYLEDIIHFSVRTGHGDYIGFFLPGKRGPELEGQRHGIKGVIGEAAHICGCFIIKFPFITDFVARMARGVITDKLDFNFILCCWQILPPYYKRPIDG
jgi:hypothetical protein